jgi:hypothetical protein
MSNNSTQRVRRNASPASSKQGPMKATLQFSLMQGSPTRTNGRKSSPSSSPTPSRGSDRVKSRRSPDNRTSPERRSPSSPGIKGKFLRALSEFFFNHHGCHFVSNLFGRNVTNFILLNSQKSVHFRRNPERPSLKNEFFCRKMHPREHRLL